ncbi:neuronal cell adhesion molecule-like [Petromyzon marinus]|uniref:neuronal cell adhesion molecule-like n=1 Tax=Petromyzon marinus TaxID=7757 RepID=UPI003F722303
MEAFSTTTACFVALLASLLGALCDHPLVLPLGVTQPPSITRQSRVDYIVDPRDNIVVECEAHGNPTPKFWWSKDGRSFDPDSDPHVRRHGKSSGTFTVDMAAVVAASADYGDDSITVEAYEGVYRCSAENRAGTALTANITVRLARAPLWPRELLQPIMATEGSPAVLRCHPPHGFPPPTVFWLDGSMEKVPLDARVSQGLDGDLYFANVLPSDRGDYVCYARYPHTGTIQYKQPLRLVVKPERPSKSRPVFLEPVGETSTKMVLSGETLLLTCITQGLPTPEVSWSKWGGAVSSEQAAALAAALAAVSGTALAIRNASESDGGDYRCRAVNSEGVALHTVTVTVESKPYWTAPVPENRDYTLWDTVELTCRASGIPTPTIRWFINGVPIDEAPEVLGRRVDGDSLTLTWLEEEDTGVYQCEASNRHGTILANAYVNVLAVPPRMLSEPDTLYTATEGQVMYMECAVFGLPRPNIIWFKGEDSGPLLSKRYQTFANGTLLISNLLRTDSDTYTCFAMNKLHYDQLQARLFVEVASNNSEPGAVPHGDLAWPSATPRMPDGGGSGLWSSITTATATTTAATTTVTVAATAATTTDSTTTTTRHRYYGVSTPSPRTPASIGSANADDVRSSSEEETAAMTKSPFISSMIGVVALLTLVTFVVSVAWWGRKRQQQLRLQAPLVSGSGTVTVNQVSWQYNTRDQQLKNPIHPDLFCM